MEVEGRQNLSDLCSTDEQESTCGTREHAVNARRSYFCCSSSAGGKDEDRNSRGEPHAVVQGELCTSSAGISHPGSQHDGPQAAFCSLWLLPLPRQCPHCLQGHRPTPRLL
ncbi:unnamed protein product [Rangifer tarandus platyrhynchus]|uniref:Uncharacterized protein n=2 Tax=Rangifer tarandus platyrhynchus TaxID=3082113 RepID=A0ABN8Y7I1_RANTA|nr:unnamed protein product [Rangifer tarandus platyrhynchus]CAI9695038.1 unnamed protein product [Rangifer tarandus platyrhynchus]